MATYGTLTTAVAPDVSESGQAVRLTFICRDSTASLIDPATLTVTVNAPDGTVATVTIGSLVRDSLGTFHYDYLPTVVGIFSGSGISTVPNASADLAFQVMAGGTDWQPSSADVATLLARRTVDATGLPTGNFSATSTPTATQVGVLVDDIAGEVAAVCGPIPAVLYDDAKLVAILGVAALIEDTFDENATAVATLYGNRYQASLTRLATACAQINQSGQVEPAGSPPAPLFNFPDLTYATTADTIW